MKKSALMLLIILLPLAVKAQTPYRNEDGKKIDKEELETKDYLPEIHGTIRTKFEYQTEMAASRFEVRNARISITGNVLPIVAYKAEIDLSFIAKQVGNVRDVGVTLGYKLGTEIPVTLEGGLYNGSGLTNQKEWHKEANYSAKAQFLFAQKLNLALSIQSIQPQDVRINSYDIGAFYQSGRFHIEGEYLYKTYAGNAYDNVHAVNSFINYDLPLRKVFNKMSFLVRYDMMTSQSDGKAVDKETGALVTTDYKRHRVTGGVTFSLSKAFRTDLRLNFEKYFYAKNSIAKESEQDKIVLELMVRF